MLTNLPAPSASLPHQSCAPEGSRPLYHVLIPGKPFTVTRDQSLPKAVSLQSIPSPRGILPSYFIHPCHYTWAPPCTPWSPDIQFLVTGLMPLSLEALFPVISTLSQAPFPTTALIMASDFIVLGVRSESLYLFLKINTKKAFLGDYSVMCAARVENHCYKW